MICAECHRELSADWTFCPFCGVRTNRESRTDSRSPDESKANVSRVNGKFTPAFEPRKSVKKLISEWDDPIGGHVIKNNYPHEYGGEVFRSTAEVEWAKSFDRVGLRWEYEPLTFDMGPEYVTYTPDFVVSGLKIPGQSCPLYIEVKRFPDLINFRKYVYFTEWYQCNLLLLAHDKGGVFEPKKTKHFIVARCSRCNEYEYFSCNDVSDVVGEISDLVLSVGPEEDRVGLTVIENYFLIQMGTIRRARVCFPTFSKRED